jgi:hypothetical protein
MLLIPNEFTRIRFWRTTPEDQNEASGIREPTRSDLMLLVKGQLLAEEQILGGQRSAGGKA